jgi:WD40 repeat protein
MKKYILLSLFLYTACCFSTEMATKLTPLSFEEMEGRFGLFALFGVADVSLTSEKLSVFFDSKEEKYKITSPGRSFYTRAVTVHPPTNRLACIDPQALWCLLIGRFGMGRIVKNDLDGDIEELGDIKFSPDGDKIAAVCGKKSMRVFYLNFEDKVCGSMLFDPNAMHPITACSFNAASDFLAVARGKDVKFWPVERDIIVGVHHSQGVKEISSTSAIKNMSPCEKGILYLNSDEIMEVDPKSGNYSGFRLSSDALSRVIKIFPDNTKAGSYFIAEKDGDDVDFSHLTIELSEAH